ncbi:MAG: hypothetical protein LC796_12180 [Acidobacteria bacterium]|nr:hypothetical protein [Acidobacteriota bacterium]MCA1612247.1 hypothetical protein [Acidobacteriota bacterium]
MKTFFAVARREVVEKKFVFAAAAVASLIPFAVPLVRSMSAASAREARGFAALLFATTVSNGVALALGASIFAGDLANRRSGFYFSRPISAAALWAGKLAAALAIALASVAIILIPTFLADRGLAPLRGVEGGAAGAALAFTGSLLFVLLAANAASLIVRSRSSIAVADLAALTAIGFAAAAVTARLWRVMPDPPLFLRTVLLGSGLAVIAAFLAGSYRALAAGRTDLYAAHRAFSATAWSLLGGAAVLFAAWAAWVLAAPPSSLDSLSGALPLGSAGWVSLDGRARSARAGFLYDSRSSRFLRTGGGPIVASEDGSVAAWVEGETAVQGPWHLRTLRLEDRGAVPADPKISFRSRPELFLSSDGDRLGAIDFGLLSIFEVFSGRSLGSVRIAVPPRDVASARFVGPGTVRIFRSSIAGVTALRPDMQILEYDVAGRTLAQAGATESLPYWGMMLINRAGDRFVSSRTFAGTRITLRDARTGAVLATLRQGPPLRSTLSRFLSDGRLVLALGDNSASWLEVFSPSGEKERRIEIGGSGRLRPGPEVAAGRLAVAWIRDLPGGRQAKPVLEIADLDRGTAAPVADGLVPIGDWWWSREGPAPGSEASKLFLDERGEVVRFDPPTGQKKVVLGADTNR